MRYRYDELERRVEASYPHTHPGKDEQVRYRYDSCPLGLGRLCERHDESGRTAYRYDVWGNVVEREHELFHFRLAHKIPASFVVEQICIV